MDYATYAALTPAEQAAIDGATLQNAPVLDVSVIEASIEEDAWGRASLSDILCKIWRWVIKVAKAIISGVKEVLKDLTAAVFELLDDLLGAAGGLFSKNPILLLLLAGLGLWAANSMGLFGDDEDDDDPQGGSSRDTLRETESTAKDVAANYYTAGLYGALT